MARAPLADRYPTAVALGLIGLCPFIVLSTGSIPLQASLLASLHATAGSLQVADAIANAGYAFGAVAAAVLISRYPLRVLYPVCEGLFVVGCILDAIANGPAEFVVGRGLQGLATGLLLVVALPPLVTRFGVSKLPLTAAIVNVGLFGAATAGPLVGGAIAAAHASVALDLGFAGLGLVAMGLAVVGIDPQLGRFRTEQRLLQLPLLLALAATLLPFLASSMLPSLPFTSALYLSLTVVGVAALVVMMVRQSRLDRPLVPVRLLATTLPVTGTLCAMVGGAAFVGLDELCLTSLLQVRHLSPLAAGELFWPQILGVAVAAVVFALVFRTRFVPVLAVSGLIALLGAGLLLSIFDPASASHASVVELSAALLGLGAGASVSPGLFMAGLGAPSNQIGPAFALVELLRSEAAFIAAPVLLDVATGGVSPPGALVRGLGSAGTAVVVMLGVAVVALVVLFFVSGARLRRPDLEAWLDDGDQALDSPPLVAPLRQSA